MSGYDSLRPWDLDADPGGRQPLHPFTTGEDLIMKTIECFYRLHPLFGECLQIMNAAKHLDLNSRKGKAPGGYNSSLYETGIPFIFMNAVGSVKDLVTMVHEGGHAVHSFFTNNLPLMGFREVPSEIAEIASMSMELLSMEHWDVFFKNEDDLKQAKKEHLERILRMLPWIASVDAFQHWVYENPGHTDQERVHAWEKIFSRFSGRVVDWSGHEETRNRLWQSQLHIFEVPFYYIEYGFAQLGAIAIWRNFSRSPSSAIDSYVNALRLGYMKTIPEVYETAGIKFDFSRQYVKELATFVLEEMEKL
jgi:oligoendopeptidase F